MRTEFGHRTYSARPLHMFPHVLLEFRQIREICRRDVREKSDRPRSSSFIVIGISFRAIFLPPIFFDNFGETFCIFPGEPSPAPNILFVYRIVLFYLRYLSQMKKSLWERPLSFLRGET